MVMIRTFEEEVERHSEQKNFHGTTHLCIGQEAVATGVCSVLEKEDYITSTHRGHGHAIAKGASVDKMMAEMFGKETGYCHGLGGSMHIADVTIGHLGSNGVVGANIPLAVGAALTIQMKKQANVAVCFFGDGATNEGVFHEAMNMAAIWRLPVIFVCENNEYGMSSPIQKMSAANPLTKLGEKWDIPSISVDGNDVEAVRHVSEEAVKRARAGDGPTFIEAKTYRYRGHSRSDKQLYRTTEEVEKWQTNDPIERMKELLLTEENICESFLEKIHLDALQIVKRATEFALSSEALPLKKLKAYVFAQEAGEQ